MASMSPLLADILDGGCRNGVLNGHRFERAISQVIGDKSQLLADPSEANTLANSITNHVMAHLSMLRHLKVESACHVSSGRRFPKSGGFRRNMEASEWPMVNGLLSKMEIDNSVSMPAPIESPPLEIELDDLGFPTFFFFSGDP